MKLTKRIKIKKTFPNVNCFVHIGRVFKPVGYYYNRPSIKNPYHQTEIGRVEGFRFIVSPNVDLDPKSV